MLFIHSNAFFSISSGERKIAKAHGRQPIQSHAHYLLAPSSGCSPWHWWPELATQHRRKTLKKGFQHALWWVIFRTHGLWWYKNKGRWDYLRRWVRGGLAEMSQLCAAKWVSHAVSKSLQSPISIGWNKALNATHNLFIFSSCPLNLLVCSSITWSTSCPAIPLSENNHRTSTPGTQSIFLSIVWAFLFTFWLLWPFIKSKIKTLNCHS